MTTDRQKLTEPLGTVTAIFGALMLVAAVAVVVMTLAGPGSIGGFGNTRVCATQPNIGYGGEHWASDPGVSARPGATISINGTLQVCAAHPTVGQRALETLITLPGGLVWGAVLFLLWRIIRTARRTGPFTVPVATEMRRLGWLLIAGSAAVGAVQGFALDQLLNTMLVPQAQYGDVISMAVKALVPVALLAGAALLTFARIIRAGADMDDEIKGTV